MSRTKRLARLNKRTWLSAATLAMALIIVSPLVYAARPYFKVFGADVFTGGWFNSGSDACTTSPNYQDPSPDQTGGILAFSKIGASPGNPTGGSSSQFAALSVGSVMGAFSSQFGFYSSGQTLGVHPASQLTFANDSGNLGGKMEGSPPVQGNCIPDYYTIKQDGTATPLSGNIDLSALSSGSYFYDIPSGVLQLNTTGGADTITPGKNITLFVNGNVHIHNNITYSGSPTASSVPKFALVVRGSIYIDWPVIQLDGLYIAQPDPAKPTQVGSDPAADHGIIWTCRNATDVPTLAWVGANCRTSKLTINGALIAKQVNLLRIKGDVLNANVGEQPGCVLTADNSPCAIEVVNYTPAMVFGGPFFNPTTSSSSPRIQSLTSLPPVF